VQRFEIRDSERDLIVKGEGEGMMGIFGIPKKRHDAYTQLNHYFYDFCAKFIVFAFI
jgi:hypothetical protein